MVSTLVQVPAHDKPPARLIPPESHEQKWKPCLELRANRRAKRWRDKKVQKLADIRPPLKQELLLAMLFVITKAPSEVEYFRHLFFSSDYLRL